MLPMTMDDVNENNLVRYTMQDVGDYKVDRTKERFESEINEFEDEVLRKIDNYPLAYIK